MSYTISGEWFYGFSAQFIEKPEVFVVLLTLQSYLKRKNCNKRNRTSRSVLSSDALLLLSVGNLVWFLCTVNQLPLCSRQNQLFQRANWEGSRFCTVGSIWRSSQIWPSTVFRMQFWDDYLFYVWVFAAAHSAGSPTRAERTHNFNPWTRAAIWISSAERSRVFSTVPCETRGTRSYQTLNLTITDCWFLKEPL